MRIGISSDPNGDAEEKRSGRVNEMCGIVIFSIVANQMRPLGIP